MWFENRCNNWIYDVKLCIYTKFQLPVIILLEIVNFNPLPFWLPFDLIPICRFWEVTLGIEQFWKTIPMSIKNGWETNFTKVIQKILVLDLSIFYCSCSMQATHYPIPVNWKIIKNKVFFIKSYPVSLKVTSAAKP